MAPEGREQVVEEADAGRHVVAAGAVEVELDEDLGLLGRALDASGARRHRVPRSTQRFRDVDQCLLNAVISCGVPIETRSQPSGPTSRISTPRSSRPCQTACRSGNRPNSA